MLSETNPVSMLSETSSSHITSIPLSVFGKTPLKEFDFTLTIVAFPSNPISDGKHPESSLFSRTISFSVCDIFPMLFGMQPLILLFASTNTETGEFPRFSGIWEVNKLSFKNKASRSISKSSGGNSPSKLLNLRSRNLRLCISRTTVGKGPTKRLLLTSSSCIRVSLEKVLGMIPQNLLEFIWKSATSVSRPNSTGR